MKITVAMGSRADFGLLEMPIKALQADPYFQGQILDVRGHKFDMAFSVATQSLEADRPDMLLLLGDRFEILAVATAAHLLRVPIAHIAGGDVTLGSYDDAMRDCISRMATIHFPTSHNAALRLQVRGYDNVHMIGNLALDFILNGDWKRERPIAEPYVVVSYQCETIDGTNDIMRLLLELPEDKHQCFVMPNADSGSYAIR